MSGIRILIVSPFPPRLAADHGGARVVGRLAYELAATNEVGVLCLQAGDEPSVDVHLAERLGFLGYVPRPRRRGRLSRVRRAGRIVWGWARGEPRFVTNYLNTMFEHRLQAVVADWQPDVIQFEFHVLAGYGSSSDPARVVVVHEPGRDTAAAEGGLLVRVDAWAWRRYERRVLSGADAVVVFSDEDRLAVERSGAHLVTRIPFGADLLDLPHSPHETPTVLYWGNYSHAPNLAAAGRLADAIFPLVLQKVPSARLALAGRAPTRGTLPIGPGVDHLGFVEDVTSLLGAATIVAAPLSTGGGMRVKVAESLAGGKAVVATRRAMAGIGATPGKHYAAAESDEEFAAEISRLLMDDGERVALEVAAKEFASTSLRWQNAARSYVELYERLGRSPTGDK